MPLTLRSDVALEARETEGYALLRKRDPTTPGPRFRLHPLQAVILALFDGRREAEEVEGIFAAAFSREPEQARRAVEAVRSRYRQFLVAAEGVDDATLPDPASFLFETRYDFSAQREAAPAALLWVVTECCARRCPYCYKDAAFVGDGRAVDLGLTTDRMLELIDEAADIGVRSIVLTGGEPFLRPDLIDLIAHMVRRGLEIIPITKQRITGERMAALARAGLRELHVSLDSHRPATVARLTGTPGAFDDLTATVRAAVEHGVPVVLRPVLTSFNVRDLPDLVHLAYGLGVRQFIPDVYGESCGRHDPVFEIADDDWAWLRRQGSELVERYPEAELKFKFDKMPLPEGQRAVGRGCVEGMRGMTFLPDGRVTKCEHWRAGDDLIYGDLRVQSILEVWSAPRIGHLLAPSRESFEGTLCERCNRFDTCNLKRGRCSLSALLEHQTPCAPDVYCPIGAFQRPTERGARHARSA